MSRKKSSIITSSKSYMSLIYGAVTVVVLFAIVFLGIRAFNQRNVEITEEAGQTKVTLYEVKEGDTLWSISEKFYKDGFQWQKIAEENKIPISGKIETGMKLTIPEISVSTTVSPAPTIAVAPDTRPAATEVAKITGNSYTVVRDDNLWTIAVRAYGDGYKWVAIAEANNLKNPDLIHAGNKFVLPR